MPKGCILDTDGDGNCPRHPHGCPSSGDRYEMPVNGVPPEELAEKMKKAHDEVRKLFPKRTGILVMTFDFGAGGGCGYICNGERSDMIRLLEEWIANQRRMH